MRGVNVCREGPIETLTGHVVDNVIIDVRLLRLTIQYSTWDGKRYNWHIRIGTLHWNWLRLPRKASDDAQP